MHPYLLHAGHLYLPTFGALAALGLMFALTLSERTARWAGLPAEPLWNAGVFAVLAAFALSRLLLVVANFTMFRRFPMLLLAVPSLTASGLLLTAIATAVWLHLHRLAPLRVLDAWSPCAALLWMFLALGHFAEGSDPGMPWAHGVHMPGDAVATYPVALFAALAAVLLLALLLVVLRREIAAGVTAGVGLVAAGTAQFLLTFARLPGEPLWAPLPGPLDALEWLALGMIVAGAVLLACARTARRPLE